MRFVTMIVTVSEIFNVRLTRNAFKDMVTASSAPSKVLLSR